MQAVQFVAACEMLAEQFEQAGRLDLATFCDKAAFWLEGGPRIDHLSLDEVVTACRESVVTERPTCEDDQQYCQDITTAIALSLRQIQARVQRTSIADRIELAARLRAVAILTQKLL